MPAHQTHARFALINNVYILESWLGFWDFFHDLGRIHTSLFRLPRCSKVTYLGLVVLVLSLTSDFLPKSGCPQHLLLSLKSMSNWQFWTGQSFVVAWRSLLIPFHPSLARSRRIIVYLKSSKTDIARKSQSLTIVRPLFPPLCRCSCARVFSLS